MKPEFWAEKKGGIGKREEMIYKKRLPYQIWWTTTLLPEYKRCKYYFELRTEKEVWYYFEDGFLTEEQLRMDGRMQQCFIVPWMNPADINRTPAWVNETIWYQIFPDRFCNGTPEKNGDDITPWRNHGTVTNERKIRRKSGRDPSEIIVSAGTWGYRYLSNRS